MLTSCSASNNDNSQPDVPAPTTVAARTTSSATATTTEAVAIADHGVPFDVACDSSGAKTCMTVTFDNIRPIDSCGVRDQYLKNGSIIAIDVEFDVASDASAAFTSPFRSFPWSVPTADRQI